MPTPSSIPDATVNPSPTAKLWNKFSSKPFGKNLFSLAFGLKAPYFLTILPRVQDMRVGYAKVRVARWWLVLNHIGTLHAIAACNAAELAMGSLAEASVPATHRWLPKGMRTEYLAKTKGGVTAVATAELPDFAAITKETGGQTVTVNIEFTDDEGKVPMKAEIDIWVTAVK